MSYKITEIELTKNAESTCYIIIKKQKNGLIMLSMHPIDHTRNNLNARII